MKKVILLTPLLWIIVFFSYGQPWKKNLPANKSKRDITLKEYKKAFEDYWAPFNVKNGYYFDENGKKTKAPGWKQFKRWEYFWEPQVDFDGKFPQETSSQVFQQYSREHPQLKSAMSANWENLGPNSSEGGYAGIGRINCIAFHPSDNNTYWVGAASGGLWKTTDNGSSWLCLTDNNAVLGISDILIPSDYSTSNTIYLATGDRDAFDNYSVGVLKSTDGGLNWAPTALSYNLSEFNMVSRLLLDPINNNTILAATSTGVYKTTNAGANWSSNLNSTAFIDMEYKPGNFNILYGSTKSGDIYTSTDGGVNWSKSLDTEFGRVELAVSVNKPTWVYAVVGSKKNGLQAIYKSENSGGSFVEIFSGTPTNLLGWDAEGGGEEGQAWYDLALAASPSDGNIVLVGGINTWRSLDGGITWTCINHWWGQNGIQAVHADKQILKYRPDGFLAECNDGGIYVSNNNGDSFTDKTDGMVISQMYKLSVSQTNINTVLTGLQDNGTKLLSNNLWYDVVGGDGMECIIDYTDENVQYASLYYGELKRTKDGWSAQPDDITPDDTGSWVTPIIMDPMDNKTLYAGYGFIWKTTNQGDSWTKISSINLSNKFRTLAIAPSDNKYIYAAGASYDNNGRYQIFRTNNGGMEWTNIGSGLPLGISIASITVKHDDPNTIWITLGQYDSNSVFQSTDGGNTWTDISAGLPEMPIYTLVQNKQETNTLHLYAGAEIGVYFKNGDNDWILYSEGLPNVTTRELEIYYNENASESKLRLATFGRGLWESNLVEVSPPVQMVYQSSTTVQNNITAVIVGSVEQEIIGVQVKTDGSISPLSVSSFTFNTNGSTSAVNDIENAKIWYTGENSIFSASSQFGDIVLSPNGTFTISGTQNLKAGTNYFWLTFDIKSGATESNLVDAECTSVTVTGNAKIPTITAPSGSRTIIFDPCGEEISIFPWTEDFETGVLPDCWNLEYVSGVLDWGYQNGVDYGNPASAHGGSFNAFLFYDSNEIFFKTKLVTPKLDLTLLSNPSISFWHTQSNWEGDQDELRVYYKTSATGSWILLAEYTNDIPAWTEEKITLPNATNEYYIAFEGYTSYGYGVCLDDITIQNQMESQQILLNSGWNIFSTTVIPNDSNLMNIFQPLITANKLRKVMDEEGHTIEDWGVFGDWQNSIGNLKITEGYKINVTDSTTLVLEGNSVQFPFEIPLNVGWNIISWPSVNEQDGLEVFQSLIDAGVLKKVMDEEGSAIEDWGVFGSWQNGIGNLKPGEGYKVNVTSASSLTIIETGNKSLSITSELIPATYFLPAFEGNGIDHMNINLVNLVGAGIMEGDEIGIFDGNICVGSAKISIQPSKAERASISIPVSASDDIERKNGFTSGNSVVLKLFRNEIEYPLTIQPLSADKAVFEKGVSLFAQPGLVTISTEMAKYDLPEIRFYPNPFSDEITIEINLLADAEVEVKIINQIGQQVNILARRKTVTNGLYSLTWNGKNAGNKEVAPGIYYLRIEIDNLILQRKIVLSD